MEKSIENFQSMMEETKDLVRNKLESEEYRPDHIEEKQLYFILDELEKMEQIRNIQLFHPYYPHIIVDSWDYSDPLANKLLLLSESYRNL